MKAVKESSEWDVVISDMRLGNDNGIDLLEWMRSNGYQNPFIIMTSYDESMSAVRTKVVTLWRTHIVSLSRLWLIYAALT